MSRMQNTLAFPKNCGTFYFLFDLTSESESATVGFLLPNTFENNKIADAKLILKTRKINFSCVN